MIASTSTFASQRLQFWKDGRLFYQFLTTHPLEQQPGDLALSPAKVDTAGMITFYSITTIARGSQTILRLAKRLSELPYDNSRLLLPSWQQKADQQHNQHLCKVNMH